MPTIGEIANGINGVVIGNKNRIINNITTPEDIGDDSVVYIRDKRNYKLISGKKCAACVVVTFEPDVKNNENFDFIIIDDKDKDRAFIKLLEMFSENEDRTPGIAENTVISNNCKIDGTASIGSFTTIEKDVEIGKNTVIAENCFVGHGSKIGDNCIIYPGVKIYPNTVIEGDVIIHSGVVIGSDGFGYSSIDSMNVKIPQIGGVYIETGVEIGANSTVDRATIGYTRIGKNTKIDNLVHIGHNVTIGHNSIICAMCGISGSVKIGNNVIIAGAVGLKDHIEIEDNVYIGAKAGVMEKHVKRGSKLLGIPAIDFRAEMEFIALKPKLKEMYKDIKRIKKHLGI